VKTPILKLKTCLRGAIARATATQLRAIAPRIASGPLKGCYRHKSGATCKVGRGYVLMFKPVIRVDVEVRE
jgi:hypothetical protein